MKAYKGYKLQRTATSETGRFELRNLPQCRAVIVVRQEEFAIGVRHVIVTEEQAAEPLELIVEPPRRLTIHVDDSDGKPLAKARVQELQMTGSNGPGSLHHALARRIGLSWPESDQSGTIVLDAIARSATVTGVVAHPDYVSAEIPRRYA